jgi:mono/diheme cytochrome c family protein
MILSALCILGCLLPGCSPNDAGSPGTRLPAETVGAAVYQQNCSACHDPDNLELAKKPPKLAGLFQKKTLPSGQPATDEQVRKTILDGRGIMPPFKQTLDEEQVINLLKYLHTR